MVKGKERICLCELDDFNAFEGVRTFSLYKLYDVLRNVVKAEVEEKYWHFLAQPVEVSEGQLIWYCIQWSETPKHLTVLTGHEKTRYERIKDATVTHYTQTIERLKRSNKNEECEYLEKALKTIDDQFIYCFDDKVVLAVWGMEARINKSKVSGEYAKDLFEAKLQYEIIFNAGEHGTIQEPAILSKDQNSRIRKEEIPVVLPFDKYEFTGWNEEPVNYQVTEQKIFTACYREQERPVEPEPPVLHKVVFAEGENGILYGRASIEITDGGTLKTSDIPRVETKEGFVFKGWRPDPEGFEITRNITFEAQYEETPEKAPGMAQEGVPERERRKPAAGWLMAGIRYLAALILLLVLMRVVPDGYRPWNWIKQKLGTGSGPEIDSDSSINSNDSSRRDDKGIDSIGSVDINISTDSKNDGKHDDSCNSGQRGGGVKLPKEPRVIVAIDSVHLGVDKGGVAKIVTNRLNVLIERDTGIAAVVAAFKQAYPSDDYQVVYYDTLIRRLQIKVPVASREIVRTELPEKLKDFKAFVWDETLFENLKLNDPALKDRNKSWYINACQVPQAWEITLGSKHVVVAIIDEGFDLQHPEFSGKIVKPYNVWTKNNAVFPSAKKHGTCVAGIVLANGNNGKGISGVAPNCSFMPVQVADAQGIMTVTSVVDGVLYAIYSGADVVNIALGMSFTKKVAQWPLSAQIALIRSRYREEERLWKEVFRIAEAHNTTIVVAAGNENILAGVDPLHRSPQAIIVSAVKKTTMQYSKSRFSNFGNYSTLSAPGVNVFSTCGSNGYAYFNGTSASAAIVTGSAALLKSVNKRLTTSEIKNILITTGIHIPGGIGNMVQTGKAVQALSSGQYSFEKN
jgi:subtilisin family serine protease